MRQVIVTFLLLSACAGSPKGPASVPPGPVEPTAVPGLPPMTDGTAMRVHEINIGQGAAVLIEFPCAAVLIDTGGEEDNDADFHGTELLDAYLNEFFAGRPDLNRTIAMLAITHPHRDHARGEHVVTDNFTVRNVVTNGQRYGTEQTHLLDWAAANGVPTFDATIAGIPAGGLANNIIDPVSCTDVDPTIRVLWGAVADTDLDWGREPRENKNNHSVVFRIDVGESSVLITGDLESRGIGSMMSKHSGTTILDVDLYQVGHHGSSNATTQPLLDAMTPDIALIGVGEPTRETGTSAWGYGHPRRSVVLLLQATVSGQRPPKTVQVATDPHVFTGMQVDRATYATAWDGDVVVEMKSDGTRQVWTER